MALPLEAINRESAKEKSIRHGHPSTLHLWWARRPLAAARAVLFASLVDDPSSNPEKFPTEEEQVKERNRLFGIIEELVKWENIDNQQLLDKVKKEILQSTNNNPPTLLDPFAGGGSIPLEAKRLGLNSIASDLNPVAVLINKALIEIPSKFENKPPVNPDSQCQIKGLDTWDGAAGLAEDVRYYGSWLIKEAEKRIGHLYPKVKLPPKYGGREAKVIAWLWARTVKCPNPACSGNTVLMKTFAPCTKKGKEVYIELEVDKINKIPHFHIKYGKAREKKGTVNRRGAKCIYCDSPISLEYIRSQGKENKIGTILIAAVVEGEGQKIYLPPSEITIPEIPDSDFLCDLEATEISGYFNPPIYGFSSIGSLFTKRQRIALKTLADLVQEAKSLCFDHCGDEEYAKAIAVYLTLGVGRISNRLSSFSIWNTQRETIEQTFSEQGVGMTWDFAEANPFSGSTGSWDSSLEWIPKCLEKLPKGLGKALQRDAAEETPELNNLLISTDPPYYSSITYADFADYFYGTFRYILRKDYPDLFSTLSTPKNDEAVAAWHRFNGSRELASQHFTKKLSDAIKVIVNQSNDDFPITIYYAFKEKELENDNEGLITAWESILMVLIEAGLQIIHTWPLRTERISGRKAKKNSLASSIVLVCRKKPLNVEVITRRQFMNELRKELPKALNNLKQVNIAPVDLAQSLIGPCMEIYSKYSRVLEADGKPMSVRSALQIINQELDHYLAEQEGNMDSDTRFCVAWYEQFGTKEGTFGEADVLARAKNTTVSRLQESNLVKAEKGKVRLIKIDELEEKWDPVSDRNLSVWKCTHYLVRALKNNGEHGAAQLVSNLNSDISEEAKALAYRLFTIADRKGWAEEAMDYNNLVVSWPEIQKKVVYYTSQVQISLFD